MELSMALSHKNHPDFDINMCISVSSLSSHGKSLPIPTAYGMTENCRYSLLETDLL